MMTWFTPCSWTPEGGTTGNSWWGCAARFSESWPYFRPKNVIFHTRLQNRSLKSIPIFVASHEDVLRGSSRVRAPQTGTRNEPLRTSSWEASPDSRGDSPVFSRVIFVFTFSIQRTQLNYLGAWNRLSLIRQKWCHHYQVKAKTKKKISRCISNSHISISSLFIWNWSIVAVLIAKAGHVWISWPEEFLLYILSLTLQQVCYC